MSPPAAEPLTEVARALIAPGAEGFCVHDAVGAPVVDGQSFRKGIATPLAFFERGRAAPVARLAGLWLYGGAFWPHFGHFLFESLARLWALDHCPGPFAGIVFGAPRGPASARLEPVHADLLALLGVDLPLRFVTHPTEVEALVVPRQGLGMGGLAAGTPAARAFFQTRLRRLPPAPLGEGRLYLSRLGYGERRGGHLGEEVIEANLTRAGYTAFRPERHPIATQIATYLAARQIVAPDSSALHLFGLVARPEQDLAIILRRPDGVVDLLPQIAGFTGRAPLVFDRINAMWRREGFRNETWGSFAEIDLGQVGADLLEAGFIDSLEGWDSPGPRRRARMRARIEARFGQPLVRVAPA